MNRQKPERRLRSAQRVANPPPAVQASTTAQAYVAPARQVAVGASMPLLDDYLPDDDAILLPMDMELEPPFQTAPISHHGGSNVQIVHTASVPPPPAQVEPPRQVVAHRRYLPAVALTPMPMPGTIPVTMQTVQAPATTYQSGAGGAGVGSSGGGDFTTTATTTTTATAAAAAHFDVDLMAPDGPLLILNRKPPGAPIVGGGIAIGANAAESDSSSSSAMLAALAGEGGSNGGGSGPNPGGEAPSQEEAPCCNMANPPAYHATFTGLTNAHKHIMFMMPRFFYDQYNPAMGAQLAKVNSSLLFRFNHRALALEVEGQIFGEFVCRLLTYTVQMHFLPFLLEVQDSPPGWVQQYHNAAIVNSNNYVQAAKKAALVFRNHNVPRANHYPLQEPLSVLLAVRKAYLMVMITCENAEEGKPRPSAKTAAANRRSVHSQTELLVVPAWHVGFVRDQIAALQAAEADASEVFQTHCAEMQRMHQAQTEMHKAFEEATVQLDRLLASAAGPLAADPSPMLCGSTMYTIPQETQTVEADFESFDCSNMLATNNVETPPVFGVMAAYEETVIALLQYAYTTCVSQLKAIKMLKDENGNFRSALSSREYRAKVGSSSSGSGSSSRDRDDRADDRKARKCGGGGVSEASSLSTFTSKEIKCEPVSSSSGGSASSNNKDVSSFPSTSRRTAEEECLAMPVRDLIEGARHIIRQSFFFQQPGPQEEAKPVLPANEELPSQGNTYTLDDVNEDVLNALLSSTAEDQFSAEVKSELDIWSTKVNIFDDLDCEFDFTS